MTSLSLSTGGRNTGGRGTGGRGTVARRRRSFYRAWRRLRALDGATLTVLLLAVILLLLLAVRGILESRLRAAPFLITHYESGALSHFAPVSDAGLFYHGVHLAGLSYLGPEPPDTETLRARWAEIGYDHDGLLESAVVPRHFERDLPRGLEGLSGGERKLFFVRLILPLVLAVNEEITAERERLLAMDEALQSGARLSEEEQSHLEELLRIYRAETTATSSQASSQAGAQANVRKQIATLLTKVDEIPVSLALAQAAVESGWGSSRFAREGNALFGQRGGAKTIAATDNPSARVRAFASLKESVRSYAHNLNSHPSYAAFREQRTEARATELPLAGLDYVESLRGYAENKDYAAILRHLIESNRLHHFESTRLTPITG